MSEKTASQRSQIQTEKTARPKKRKISEQTATQSSRFNITPSRSIHVKQRQPNIADELLALLDDDDEIERKVQNKKVAMVEFG